MLPASRVAALTPAADVRRTACSGRPRQAGLVRWAPRRTGTQAPQGSAATWTSCPIQL